ncbi:MAG: PKD domain-containing protein [Ferruginibacter sp.]
MKFFLLTALAFLLVECTIGQTGSSLNFDGINDCFFIPHTALLKPAAALTIEVWVKPVDIHTNTYYEIYRKEDGNARQLFSFQDHGNTLSFGLEVNGAYSELDVSITPAAYEGQWIHLAATFDGTRKRIYRNAEVIGYQDIAGTAGTTGSAPAIIGSLGGSQEFFNGTIDEFKFWNIALTGEDIKQDMYCESNVPKNGLIVYYKFNQGIAGASNTGMTTVLDASGNNINGTLLNFALSGNSSNWVSPGAVQNDLACVLPLYTFTGNGNWSDQQNWVNNKMPPDTIPAGTEIVIDPVNNGQAVLDKKQLFRHDTKLTVQANKKLIIPGDLINYNRPVANFSFTTSNMELLPVAASFVSTGTGAYVSYAWSFGDGTVSTAMNPVHNFSSGGIYNVKLVVSNELGSDSITKQLKISPYPQTYTAYNGTVLNLYAWEGKKIMVLSRNNDLDRSTMFTWLRAIDTGYNYYKACTGSDPIPYTPTYINGHPTIADVPATCGAGCGLLGFTGIEILNPYFDQEYNYIKSGVLSHVPFYELGRNYWFYGNKIENKAPAFPVAGGFAVFMGYMSRLGTGLPLAPFGTMSAADIQARMDGMVDLYMADTSLNWNNTLGVNQGVPGTNSNGADLFTSFCYRLQRDYGGDNFMKNIWKQVALRPDAVTQQDAIDNFFLASCGAANKNLTALFQSWRWPLSDAARTEALKYP